MGTREDLARSLVLTGALPEENIRQAVVAYFESFAREARGISLPKLCSSIPLSSLEVTLARSTSWEEDGVGGAMTSDDFYRLHGLVVQTNEFDGGVYELGAVSQHGDAVEYTVRLNPKGALFRVHSVTSQRTTFAEMFAKEGAYIGQALAIMHMFLGDLVRNRSHQLEVGRDFQSSLEFLRAIDGVGRSAG